VSDELNDPLEDEEEDLILGVPMRDGRLGTPTEALEESDQTKTLEAKILEVLDAWGQLDPHIYWGDLATKVVEVVKEHYLDFTLGMVEASQEETACLRPYVERLERYEKALRWIVKASSQQSAVTASADAGTIARTVLGLPHGGPTSEVAQEALAALEEKS
jgi:hypothetical protein